MRAGTAKMHRDVMPITQRASPLWDDAGSSTLQPRGEYEEGYVLSDERLTQALPWNGQPFPIRDGRIEAQAGQDSRFYCYAMTSDCAVRAVMPAGLQSAA